MSSDQSVNPFEDLPVLNGTSFDENSFAARLIQRGSNTDAPDAVTGKPWAQGLSSLWFDGRAGNAMLASDLLAQASLERVVFLP